MKSKDQDLLTEAYQKVLKEEFTRGGSIGDELYKLYTDLSPDAKTKSGARVSDVLRDILNELTEIVHNARRTANSPDSIIYLLQKLSID